MDILLIAQKEVKKNGLSQKTPEAFLKLSREPATTYLKAKELKDKLYHFFQDQVAQFPKKPITLLGTSDIIESVFGRVKSYAKNAPFKEITHMIMAIPIFTGQITVDKIKIFLEARTVKKTTKWLKNNIGETYLQKRRNAFIKRRINNY